MLPFWVSYSTLIWYWIVVLIYNVFCAIVSFRLILSQIRPGSSGLKRFRGTDLYISNETDCGTGELVYRQDSDPTNPWQSTYTIRIAGISRYIHFCNEVLHDGSADVQLCEIEAMGE